MPAPRAAIFTRVAIYNRISNDPQGIEAGVERQRQDCEALAGRLGWQVAKVYVDNDLSAWTGKRRPDYQQMLADIRAGKVDAVIVWHEDRLTRLPRELEEFADTCLKAGVHRLVSCYGDTDPHGGELWSQGNLKRILVSPRIAGLREHKGTTYPASWEAIISPEQHELLVTLLTDPARRTKPKAAGRKYLLSGLLTCGKCGRLLFAKNTARDRVVYACRILGGKRGGCGGVQRDIRLVEEFVTEAGHPHRPRQRADPAHHRLGGRGQSLRPQLPGVGVQDACHDRAGMHVQANRRTLQDHPAPPVIAALPPPTRRQPAPTYERGAGHSIRSSARCGRRSVTRSVHSRQQSDQRPRRALPPGRPRGQGQQRRSQCQRR
jgi:predicted site-specific integrase-resolvase